MYKCDGKVLCQLAGHGPGHSMPALLQPAVVSTVSTLDIYTPQSHRTPGPDNTPQYWAHTDTRGQSDVVRLRGYLTSEVNCISTILLIRWKLPKQKYLLWETERMTTTATFDACVLLMWLSYEIEVRTSPCHGCSVTGRIVAGDYNKIFAQNTSLKFNFVLDKFQYSHGRDKSLHYKSQGACLFSPLAARHGGLVRGPARKQKLMLKLSVGQCLVFSMCYWFIVWTQTPLPNPTHYSPTRV